MQKVKVFHSAKLRVLWIALALLTAAFIFLMSGEASEESGERSGGFAQIFIDIFVPDYESKPIDEQIEIRDFTDHLIRKTAHFSIFATLGAFICLSSLSFSGAYPTHFIRSLLIAALYAASDEFHQSFSPGRSPQISDVLLDSCGAAFGIVAILLIGYIVLRCKSKQALRAVPSN